MYKKLITACIALVAFTALAIGPASASATNTPRLTAPAGTTAAVGSTIIGTAGKTTFKETGGNTILTCESATLTGTVATNSGGNVEGTISSSTFVGSANPVGSEPDNACTGLFNASVTATTPWCLRSTTTMATDEFQVRGGACNEATKTLVFHLVTNSIGTCTYERTAATGPIKGTFTTSPANAELTVTSTASGSGFTRSSISPLLCPSSGVLQMNFALENKSNQAAVIDG